MLCTLTGFRGAEARGDTSESAVLKDNEFLSPPASRTRVIAMPDLTSAVVCHYSSRFRSREKRNATLLYCYPYSARDQ